jgi:hypothetical protein
MLDISRHGVTCDKSIGSRVLLIMLDGSRHGVPCDESMSWCLSFLIIHYYSRHGARCL